MFFKKQIKPNIDRFLIISFYKLDVIVFYIKTNYVYLISQVVIILYCIGLHILECKKIGMLYSQENSNK